VRGVEVLLIMLKVNQSIVINQPIEEIFAYMSALENLVDWSGAAISVRKNSPGVMHVGATVRSTVRFLGRWCDITFEIIEYKPYHYLTIKSIFGGAPCVFCYQFEVLEDGRTNVSQDATIHLTEGILELEEPAIASAVRRQLENDLLTLKDILEARTSHALKEQL
jgi:uncharacterized membrane protein